MKTRLKVLVPLVLLLLAVTWLFWPRGVVAPAPVKIPVQIGAMTFSIEFFRRPGQTEYLLPIDRIWFWDGAEAMGMAPRLDIPAGMNAETHVLSKWTKQPILY